ncbi:unnamed protein product, partial [Rotaria sp. Silwood2]
MHRIPYSLANGFFIPRIISLNVPGGYPLKTKEAEPVAEKLLQQFYWFGAPRILQSDNGKEFVAKVIKDFKKTWPDLIIINGRPRHPQTQGLVERGNQTLESALGKWMESNNRKDWSNGETSDSSDTRSVNNHQQIRAEAEASYMANIVKRQKLFNDALRQHEYKVGDLVGLKIDKVDRTNVTPKILPCKIISIQSASNDMDTYQSCTTTCVISSRFQVLDLLDLSNCNFRDLREVALTALPTMTFIQACKAYVSAGLVTPVEACNCNGNCSTKKCPCRAAKIQCGTKCHSSKTKPYSNV